MEFNETLKQFETLKGDLEAQFPGLIRKLQSGVQILVISDVGIFKELNPERVRCIGGLVALCHAYEVAFLFVSPYKVATLTSRGLD
jgi:hypothetical protein